jgi:hypothetical protein
MAFCSYLVRVVFIPLLARLQPELPTQRRARGPSCVLTSRFEAFSLRHPCYLSLCPSVLLPYPFDVTSGLLIHILPNLTRLPLHHSSFRTRARGNLPHYTGLHSSWAQISLAVCTGPRSFLVFPRSHEGDETEPVHTVPPCTGVSLIRGSPDAGQISHERWVVLICPTCEDNCYS